MMTGRTTMMSKLRIFKETVIDFLIENMIMYLKNLKKIMSLKNAKMMFREIASLFHLKSQREVLKFLKEKIREVEEAKDNGLT